MHVCVSAQTHQRIKTKDILQHCEQRQQWQINNSKKATKKKYIYKHYDHDVID